MNTEKMFEIQKHNKKLISNLNSFSLIDKEAKKIIKKNQQFFRFLILFHDIGKIQQNADHEKLSANLIDKYINGDFFSFNNKKTYLLIIENHTMLGSIFTGESSIYRLYAFENEIKQNKIDKSFFYNILIIFSTIDSWAYTDDISYSKRLYNNYKFIITTYKTIPQIINKFYNIKWRYACFLGFYKKNNYWNIVSTIKTYKSLVRHFNKKKIKISNLYNINLKYAIWLINRFYYDNKQKCDQSNKALANYDNLFYMLLDDILSNVELKDVFFINYRDSDICENVFSKLSNQEYLSKIIKSKIIKNGKVYYNFNKGENT